LCGRDPLTDRDHSHRKATIEARILELGSVFAVGVYGYAVMSNHLHVVLSVLPDHAHEWSQGEVVERWLRLFPSSNKERIEDRRAAMLGDADRIAECRLRLSDLSWFMRCLNEYLARQFNAEDDCSGRFWEGRFKCQALLNERALLAAMTYVDLNPVRARIANNAMHSRHTSVRQRAKAIAQNHRLANSQLMPLAGFVARSFPKLSEAEYVDLVDWTGRQWRPKKRGKISASEPPALLGLGLDTKHWTHQVKGVGSAYWRLIGTVEEMLDKAKELKQAWLHGIGFARRLERHLS